MGWRGAIRSINAAAKAAERDAKRRQRQLEQQQKQYHKMQELEQASYEVDAYQNHIDIIQSMHKDCSSPIDWKQIAISPEPKKPEKSNIHEEKAKTTESNYHPGLIDRIFKREAVKRQKLADDVKVAIRNDESAYIVDIKQWKEKCADWSNNTELAQKVLNNDAKTKLAVIEDINPFSEISTLGSSLSFNVNNNSIVDVTIKVHGADIIPSESKSLLKSGRVSVKKMPKGQFNELYQDYVCSCVLRVANELFSILPDEMVFVTAVDKLLNSKTGHIEESPILSVAVARDTLQSLNMDYIDPSDSMSNFVHHMSFMKTKGFEAVERLTPDSFLNM
ncbi:hypothetical protein [Sulfurovum sp.]|uniref:hypothetical protein n=1 Tax=Sulfurovum sp. TaxID=1969726 RepID=UPI003566B66C